MSNMKTALKMIGVMTLITGVAYPVLITVVAQLLFHKQANGSMVTSNGRTIGSELIGQRFTSDAYFWSRPSVIEYNPMPSSGSNLGPTSAALLALVNSRVDTLKAHAQMQDQPPADLLFASASGLDPHISPPAARYQVGRIARARHLDPEQEKALLSLVEANIETPSLGVLGEPRVNVLKLNLAVDSVFQGTKL